MFIARHWISSMREGVVEILWNQCLCDDTYFYNIFYKKSSCT